jgi:hypothetical protein
MEQDALEDLGVLLHPTQLDGAGRQRHHVANPLRAQRGEPDVE